MLKYSCMLKHLWLDAADAQDALPPALLARLSQQVADSEKRHTGQIRLCVEAALPISYLWRLGRKVPDGSTTQINQLVRERAIMLFSKLRVWDTAHNNGVLIYLQLAEHAIEIVTDRGLMHVPDAHWQALTRRMSAAFAQAQFEVGLTQALQEVSEVMVAHFPRTVGADQPNELPDAPLVG